MTVAVPAPQAELIAAFRRLFDNEFLTLDGVCISYRTPSGIYYLDQDNALDAMLFGNDAGTLPAAAENEVQALHLALFEATPDAECVVSGWSRHLRALLLEGYLPPQPTSMMRKRGIPDVAAHLVEADGLSGSRLAISIERAQALAERNDMRHLLLLTTAGMVAIAGAPFNEAVAHWHNIEFASRVECLSIEEAWIHRRHKGGSDG